MYMVMVRSYGDIYICLWRLCFLDSNLDSRVLGVSCCRVDCDCEIARLEIWGSRICCRIAWRAFVGNVADLYMLYGRYGGKAVKMKDEVDEVGV